MSKKAVWIIVAIVAVLGICVTCCAVTFVGLPYIASRTSTKTPVEDKATVETKEFRSSNPSFSDSNVKVYYPSDWERDYTQADYIVATFNVVNNETGTNFATFNVSRESLVGTGVSSVSRYYDLSYEGLVKAYPNAVFETKKQAISIDGKDAYEHTLVYPSATGSSIKQRQIITVIGDSGYVFTYSALQKNYDTYLPTINKIVAAIEVN